MKTIFVFFTALGLLVSLNSCKVGRFIAFNFADINDHKKFPARTIKYGDTQFQFVKALNGKAPKSINLKDKNYPFDDFLEKNNTVAFLIIKNDTIQYEQYWAGYNQASVVPSFSMAKSVLSILIGCAIDDKLIQSVSEPVTNYIPELKENGFDKVTIVHVLQMTSGLKFNESYINPFGHAATYYYGRNLRKSIRKMKLKTEPGKNFDYVSGNSQILGLVLERALKNKTISTYLQEKIWKPLEMEYDASWSLDKKKNGLEKTFCCLNARARDFAKIGRLYLNNGKWNKRQIVSADWVERSTQVDTSRGSSRNYQYQWWKLQKEDFMAEGILGQYIYVRPDKNLIIVRLGKNGGKADWWDIMALLGNVY